jgi:hypothetical protein
MPPWKIWVLYISFLLRIKIISIQLGKLYEAKRVYNELGGNKESIERVLGEKILYLVSVTGKKNDRIAKGYQ